MTTQQVRDEVQKALPFGISNFAEHEYGFSFTTATETQARHAAYIYRYSREVRVKYDPDLQEWLVSIWNY